MKVWFTDLNSKLLETENKINITFVINESVRFKNETLLRPNNRSNTCKRIRFFSWAKNMSRAIDKNISKSLSSKCSQKLLDHAK